MALSEPQSELARRRRRGVELEAAILDAGWDELVEVGYVRLTVGSVADRAHTSEPVLYRRWADKHDLVRAVLERYRVTHPIATPDTGSLRDDLIQHLVATSEARAAFSAIAAAVAFSASSAARGIAPTRRHGEVMGEEALPHNRLVYRQAASRGQLDLANVPPAILALPYELVRLDLLMNPVPVSLERIYSIVDELFLPLVRPYLRQT